VSWTLDVDLRKRENILDDVHFIYRISLSVCLFLTVSIVPTFSARRRRRIVLGPIIVPFFLLPRFATLLQLAFENIAV